MKIRPLQGPILVLGLLLLSYWTSATTLYVSSAGNNGRSIVQAQNRDSSLLTIAQAITLASDGDNIIVGPGTFAGFTLSKRVNIIGAGNEASGGTIISSTVTASAALNGSIRQELRNLRINNAGTGVAITTGKLSLYNVTIIACTSFGVNVTATCDDLVMIGCNITGNGNGITVANNVGVDGWVIRNTQVRANTGPAITFTQTTNPSTVDVNNLTVTNCAFDQNQTASGSNLQVLQIQKLSNALFQNCVFHRAGTNTGASNLINFVQVGKTYSNLTFKYCRFYSTHSEATFPNNLQKRGIYFQPTAGNASISNITVEGCEFSSALTGKLQVGINLQNDISGTLSFRYNAFPQAHRSSGGLQVFGGATTYGTVTATNNYWNALGASKHTKVTAGLAGTTNGSNQVTTSGIIAANFPTAGLSGSTTPTTPFAGTSGVFGILAFNSGTGVITSNPAAASTGAIQLGIFDASTLEGAAQYTTYTNWNTNLDISGFQTTALTSGYNSPVFRVNSSNTFQATHTDLATALAASANGDALLNITAKTMSGSDATLTIPTGNTVTFITSGSGRFNPASAVVYNNISIPSTSTLKLGSDILVSGTLTINGTLDLNGFNLVMSGSSAFAGSGSIYDATGFGNIVLRGSGRALGTINFASGTSLGGIIDSTTVGGSLTATGTLGLNKNSYVRLVSTVTATGLALTNGGYGFQGSGIINFGSSGTYAVNADAPIALPTGTLGNVTINGEGAYLVGATNISGTATLTAGILKVFSNTLTISGSVSTVAGSIATTQHASLALTGSSTYTLPSGIAAVNTLTINTSGVVTLGANLTTYGTINLTNGILSIGTRRLALNHSSSFSGSGAVIRGTGAGTIYVHGPITGGVTSAGGVGFDNAPNNKINTIWTLRSLTVNTDIQIAGRVRVRRGILALGGNNVTFLSSAAGTAVLDTIDASASITGISNITAQRYFGTTPRWMLVGSPISGKTLGDWQETALGTNGINFTFSTGGGTQPSVFTFTNGSSWVGGTAATLNQTFAPGRGVRIYARTPFLTLNNGATGLYGPPAGPGIMYWNGTPVTGTHNFAGITNAGNAWNLVANPYQAPIDWEAESNWTRTNVQNTMMYYTGSQYKGLIKVGPTYVSYNSGSGIIPSGQGFFVQASGASPVLSVTENAKTSATASFYRSGNNSVMRAVLTNATGTTDEVLFAFDNNSGYTRNKDAQHDVPKFSGSTLNIASYSGDNYQLTADLRPMPATRDSIRLYVQAAASGAFTLNFSNLPANATWFLKDRKLRTYTNLAVNPAYAFSILNSDTTTFGANRFELVFTPSVTSLNTLIAGKSATIYPNPSAADALMLALNGFEVGENISVQAIDALGRIAGTSNITVSSTAEHIAIPMGLKSGIYTILMRSNSGVKSQQILIQN